MIVPIDILERVRILSTNCNLIGLVQTVARFPFRPPRSVAVVSYTNDDADHLHYSSKELLISLDETTQQ